MTRATLIIRLKTLFDQNPLVAALLYLILSVIGLGLFIDSFKDYVRFSNAETQELNISTLAALPRTGKSRLVKVSGIKWQCADQLNTADDHVIPITSYGGTPQALVIYSTPEGFSSCEQHQADSSVSGVLKAIHPRYVSYLKNKKPEILGSFSERQIWTLCGDCGASDSLLGILMSGGFSLIVLWALFHYAKLGLAKPKRQPVRSGVTPHGQIQTGRKKT